MDYELVFFSEMSLIEWAEYIYDLLNRKMKIEVKYKKYSEYISIFYYRNRRNSRNGCHKGGIFF